MNYRYIVKTLESEEAHYTNAYTALTDYIYANGLTILKIYEDDDELMSISCSGNFYDRKNSLYHIIKQFESLNKQYDNWFIVFHQSKN